MGSLASGALAAVAAGSCGRRRRPTLRQFAAHRRAYHDRQLSAWDHEHTVLHVPVRGGAHTVALKRFMQLPSGSKLPQATPSILLVHGGPGLPSRYLEPLAARLRAPAGRTCYAYDQLGCGMSAIEGGALPQGGLGLQQSIQDLQDVVGFLSEDLGVSEVHLVGHGFGGALLMEALLRARIWEGVAALPLLRSVCLIGTPSSTASAEAEACRLMRDVEEEIGLDEAPKAFWYWHNCGLKPQPSCLREAYQGAAERTTGWWGFGALQGWAWRLGTAGDPGRWELKGSSVLCDWSLDEVEVAASYSQATGGAPLLVVRGEHDFITEECIAAWRAAAASAAAPVIFSEQVLDACGHNAHLEDPEAFAAKLRLWFLRVETAEQATVVGGHDTEAEPRERQRSSAPPVRGSIHVLSRSEARQNLLEWASKLSWAAASRVYAAYRRAARWEQDNQFGANPPAREVRRLAEWARELPETANPPDADAETLQQALQMTLVAGSLASGDAAASASKPRMAVGLVGEGGGPPKAIVCIEAAGPEGFGLEIGAASANATGVLSGLRVVGAVAAPHAPDGMRDAALHKVQKLIFEPLLAA